MSNGVLAGLRAVFGDRVHVWSEPPYLYHDWGGSSRTKVTFYLRGLLSHPEKKAPPTASRMGHETDLSLMWELPPHMNLCVGSYTLKSGSVELCPSEK